MRTVRADFAMQLNADTEFVLLILPSAGHHGSEAVTVTLDGERIDATEHEVSHGTRELRFRAGPGALACTLDARIEGTDPTAPDEDVERYLQASRYVEVDELRDFAVERFGRARGWDAVDAVVRHVARSLEYDMWRSEIDDTAATTLQKGGGMCRDFAHVVIGLCRALGVPARYASVFAPRLMPPDFHAVAEVFVDDAWWVVDATHLAPRPSMVRIATGIDAEETAWSTNTRGSVELGHLDVTATDDAIADDAVDDRSARVRLA